MHWCGARFGGVQRPPPARPHCLLGFETSCSQRWGRHRAAQLTATDSSMRALTRRRSSHFAALVVAFVPRERGPWPWLCLLLPMAPPPQPRPAARKLGSSLARLLARRALRAAKWELSSAVRTGATSPRRRCTREPTGRRDRGGGGGRRHEQADRDALPAAAGSVGDPAAALVGAIVAWRKQEILVGIYSKILRCRQP